MKHTLLKFCLFGIMLSLVFACEKPVGGEDNPSGNKPGLLSGVTVDVNLGKVTATTAAVSYSVDLGEASNMPIDVKIRYSIAESLSGPSSVVKTLDKSASSVVLSGLQFDRQYFYEVRKQICRFNVFKHDNDYFLHTYFYHWCILNRDAYHGIEDLS